MPHVYSFWAKEEKRENERKGGKDVGIWGVAVGEKKKKKTQQRI